MDYRAGIVNTAAICKGLLGTQLDPALGFMIWGIYSLGHFRFGAFIVWGIYDSGQRLTTHRAGSGVLCLGVSSPGALVVLQTAVQNAVPRALRYHRGRYH